MTLPASSGQEIGGNRGSEPHRDPASTWISPRITRLGHLQGVDSSSLLSEKHGMPEVSGNLYYIPSGFRTRQRFLLLVRSFILSWGPMEKNQSLRFPCSNPSSSGPV